VGTYGSVGAPGWKRPGATRSAEMSLPGDPRAGRGSFRLSEYAVAVNPLTGEFVGASNTGALHFWTPSGAPLRTVFIGPPGGRIPDLEFTPDGRYLITANGNGTIYVLRVARNLN
jgi:WD40 repeat protein